LIPRTDHEEALGRLLRQFPIVGLIGARQIGKTTLARALAASAEQAHYFDLEDPRDVARLEHPMLALESLKGLVVLDEVQHKPEVFAPLRVLADRPSAPARFLVLGSASPRLLQQSSETLAGRIAYHHLEPLDMFEVGFERRDVLWLRGGFPCSFAAATDAESTTWRRSFVRTYLERDLASLGITLAPPTMRRFWMMLAHYHAQLWNAAELARSFAVSEKTVRRYLDILVSTFMTRRIEPWHENIRKRQVKAPKIYLSDSGLLHILLGIYSMDALLGHPKVGASWEGFAIQQILRKLRAEPEECFFWAVHTGAELDLFVVRGTRRLGFEVKLTDAPRVTTSMRSALETLHLDSLDVVHAGNQTFPLSEQVRALALARIDEDLEPL
jgi:hypothetical protein